MDRISLQELETLLTSALTKFGLKTTKAHTLARETAVKARKQAEPEQRIAPAILIEDNWKALKNIRLRLKPGVKKKPDVILKNFLTGKKGYPPFEAWQIQPEFGGPEAPFFTWLATLKPKPKTPKKPKATEKDILDDFQSLPKERQKEIMEQLIAQG